VRQTHEGSDQKNHQITPMSPVVREGKKIRDRSQGRMNGRGGQDWKIRLSRACGRGEMVRGFG